MLLGMAFVLPLLFLKPLLGHHGAREDVSPPTSAKTSITGPQAPWGELQYTQFALGQPEAFLPDSTNPLPTPAWYFEKMTPKELTALFKSVDTAPSTRELLLRTNRWQVSADTVIVHPSTKVILELGRPARERIYAALANSPLNMPQYYPFRFRGGGFDQWFAQSQLAPEKLDLIRSLTYTNRGGAICLADLDVLQEKLGREDFHHLLESLYSEQSLFLSLRIEPSSDIERLAHYWGIGGRVQEVFAMLKSIAKSGGGSVDVTYLLPPFARLRLYRFAAPSDESVTGQDCFWTALNFFRTETQAQMETGNRSLELLTAQCSETKEAPRFGDVIVFLESGKPAHACVYIADDVVFTKNGVNLHQPWVLMKLNDVLPRYATDRPMSLVVLRRNTT